MGIAEISGLSTGFVGVALVAVVTSLPEVVTTIAAARIGAYNLAIGNLFGSNAFNIFALGLVDLFFLDGRFLAIIDPTLTIAGLMGLLLTCLALIGNLAHEERRLFFIEVDALMILIGYIGGMWLLFSRVLGEKPLAGTLKNEFIALCPQSFLTLGNAVLTVLVFRHAVARTPPAPV